MRTTQNRSIYFIFLVVFFGVIVGSIFSQFIGAVLPSGVVKDFFLASKPLGWGINDGGSGWIDLLAIRIRTGFVIDVSVVSILGMGISWYFLRYFK